MLLSGFISSSFRLYCTSFLSCSLFPLSFFQCSLGRASSFLQFVFPEAFSLTHSPLTILSCSSAHPGEINLFRYSRYHCHLPSDELPDDVRFSSVSLITPFPLRVTPNYLVQPVGKSSSSNGNMNSRAGLGELAGAFITTYSLIHTYTRLAVHSSGSCSFCCPAWSMWNDDNKVYNRHTAVNE